jgi:glutamyl-tRNA reductase
MSTDRSEGTHGPTGADPERTEEGGDPPPDPERIRRRLRRRADEIERREVEEAVSALDARGGLTAEQRETVRAFGSALVEGLTAAPERTLARATEDEEIGERDRERARAIRRLFDIDEA